jgi:predicted RNA-binding protein with PIN domain
VTIWVVDGNNVYGSRPDGWWKDRRQAARRLAAEVDEWQRGSGDEVLLVFDGRPDRAILDLVREELSIEFAPGPGPDAADQRIVELVEDRLVDHPPESVTVVTSDRGLVDRLAPGVRVEGSRSFLRALGSG